MTGLRDGAAAATGFRAEDMFLAWLFHLPAGADICNAARTEMARLDREGGVEDGARYREFLSQAMRALPVRGPRRRRHH